MQHVRTISLKDLLSTIMPELMSIVKETDKDILRTELIGKMNNAIEVMSKRSRYVTLNPEVYVTGVLQDPNQVVVTENAVHFSYKTKFKSIPDVYAENTCALCVDNHTFYFIGLQADLPPTLIAKSASGDAFITWNPFLEKKKPHPYWEKALEIAKQINTRFYEHGQE